MRDVSTTLSAFLDNNTACSSAELYTVTPRAGSVVRWTSYGADVSFGGYTFTAQGSGAAPIIKRGSFKTAAGLEIATLDLALETGEGATFNGVRLPFAAEQGLLDGAALRVERVFGFAALDTSMGSMVLFEGVIDNAQPTSYGVKLDISAGIAALNIQLPRIIIQAGCTNILFDAQCSLNKSTYTVAGTVTAGSTTTSILSLRAEAADYFRLGVITFTSGTLSGVQRAVRGFSGGTFTLDRPLPSAPAAGVTFTVYPGCDKTKATCTAKFANLVHLRAFPFVPSKEASSLV